MPKKQATADDIIRDIQSSRGVVGRDIAIADLIHCIRCGKHVLLEGPVGVGKTHLVNSVSQYLDKKVVRVDGDTRFTEQKLTGWFDPPTVLKKGYTKEAYFDGPLASAMRGGCLLFINELNRMPEGVQNILLPALDEGIVEIPKIGLVKAKPGFTVVATMNPREFVATTHISEALMDRFELILLSYQDAREESEILKLASSYAGGRKDEELLDWAVTAVRATRDNPRFKRGASVRAAVSIYDIAMQMGGGWENFQRACSLALPTRVELSDEGIENGMENAILHLTEDIKKKA